VADAIASDTGSGDFASEIAAMATMRAPELRASDVMVPAVDKIAATHTNVSAGGR
jgi:hypothetical protein